MFASPLRSTPASALKGIVDRAEKTAPSATDPGSRNDPLATRALRRSLLFGPMSYAKLPESVIVALGPMLLMLPRVAASVYDTVYM